MYKIFFITLTLLLFSGTYAQDFPVKNSKNGFEFDLNHSFDMTKETDGWIKTMDFHVLLNVNFPNDLSTQRIAIEELSATGSMTFSNNEKIEILISIAPEVIFNGKEFCEIKALDFKFNVSSLESDDLPDWTLNQAADLVDHIDETADYIDKVTLLKKLNEKLVAFRSIICD